jgi:hypothetical protein
MEAIELSDNDIEVIVDYNNIVNFKNRIKEWKEISNQAKLLIKEIESGHKV